MASRKSLRARQVELAAEIKKQADRLAGETSPAKADISIEMIDRTTGELRGIIETLATVGA